LPTRKLLFPLQPNVPRCVCGVENPDKLHNYICFYCLECNRWNKNRSRHDQYCTTNKRGDRLNPNKVPCPHCQDTFFSTTEVKRHLPVCKCRPTSAKSSSGTSNRRRREEESDTNSDHDDDESSSRSRKSQRLSKHQVFHHNCCFNRFMLYLYDFYIVRGRHNPVGKRPSCDRDRYH
jgi:hypothetical protein